MLTVEPEKALSDMVLAQLLCFIDEVEESIPSKDMGPLRTKGWEGADLLELAIKAYRCGWAQHWAEARKELEERGEQIGVTEHGDKVYAVRTKLEGAVPMADRMALPCVACSGPTLYRLLGKPCCGTNRVCEARVVSHESET